MSRSAVFMLLALLAGPPARAIEGHIRIDSAPTVISAPGHYYVDRNLSAPGIVITIEASDVHLNLNGFQLESTGTGTTDSAVFAFVRGGLTIRNGRLKGGRYGILMGGASDLSIEDVTAEGAIEHGIWLDDPTGFAIRNSRFRNHGGDGIRITSGPVVEPGAIEGNLISSCGGGIHAEASGIIIRNNHVHDVVDGGVYASSRSVVENNAVWNAGGDGIVSGFINIVTENVVSDAAGDGIRIIGWGNQILDNTVQGSTGAGARVEGSLNQLAGNTLNSNGAYGLAFTSAALSNVYRQNMARGNTPGSCTGPSTSDFCDDGANDSDAGNFIPGLQ